MLRFKDMFPMGIEYRPGEDELINYRALRRKRTIGVGEGGPIGEQTDVDESLDQATRLKKARDLRRNKAKLKMGRERAARKFATREVLMKRARRAAYKAMYNKLSKGVPNSDLTPSRKKELEKRLEKPVYKTKIEKIARKTIKDVRKKEQQRKRG
jgi:hypothetical protein